MYNFLIATSGSGEDNGNSWILLVIMGVVLVAFLVMSMLSRRRGGKQVNDMRSTLRVGDEIMTIGGIVGTVVEIRERSPADKDFIIETGSGANKSTMLFDLRALHENRTRMKEIQAEAAKQAEIARAQREAKKRGISPEEVAQQTEYKQDDNKENK